MKDCLLHLTHLSCLGKQGLLIMCWLMSPMVKSLFSWLVTFCPVICPQDYCWNFVPIYPGYHLLFDHNLNPIHNWRLLQTLCHINCEAFVIMHNRWEHCWICPLIQLLQCYHLLWPYEHTSLCPLFAPQLYHWIHWEDGDHWGICCMPHILSLNCRQHILVTFHNVYATGD